MCELLALSSSLPAQLNFSLHTLGTTDLAISHIRHAARGSLSLANTQPFTRELAGRSHVFAHNGDLPGVNSVSVAIGTSLHFG